MAKTNKTKTDKDNVTDFSARKARKESASHTTSTDGNNALKDDPSGADEPSGETVSVFTVLGDAPIETDLVIPIDAGYRLNKNGVYHRVNDRGSKWHLECIANAPVLINRRLRDIDTNDESLEVAWRRDGWHKEIVSRASLMNASKIIELAAKGFPVNSNNARNIIGYLTAFEAVNLKNLPLDYATRRFGWQGKDGARGFLIGTELITENGTIAPDADTEHRLTFRGSADGDDLIAEGFHRHGTLEGWIAGVAPLADYPKVLLNVYAAFVPPLLNIYKCGNFTMDISGRTSTGKSTTQSIAASICGNPGQNTTNPVIHNWNLTSTYFERLCAISTDLPVFLDDTKQAKNEQSVENAVYDLHNGHGKGRGNTKGLDRTARWRSVLLSTGEAPITSFGKESGGARARVLAVTGAPFDADKAGKIVREVSTAVFRHYGHALPLFMRWVLSHKDEWDAWVTEYLAECDRLTACDAVQDNIAGRLANFMAAVTCTAKLVHRAFEESGHALPWQYTDDLLAGVWAELAQATKDAPVETRGLRDVYTSHLINPV